MAQHCELLVSLCSYIKCIQPSNLPLKGKIETDKTHGLKEWCPYSLTNGERACQLSSINLRVSLTSLSDMDKQMRTDERIQCLCTPTLTPTQKMSLCHVVSSVAVGSLQSVGLLHHCLPPERGSASIKVSLAVTRLTWHLTSASVTFTFGHCCRSGGEKLNRGHLWQLEHKLILSLRLSLCVPNCIFPCHYLKFLVLSSFSFSHNLSASLIVKLPACSCALLSSPTIIFVWFFICNSAS